MPIAGNDSQPHPVSPGLSVPCVRGVSADTRWGTLWRMKSRAPVAATPTEAQEPQWLTRKQAAAFTLCSISSVRHAARRGEIKTRVAPATGQVLYDSHDLSRWRTRVSRNADQLKPALEALTAGASPLELVTTFGFEPDRARKLVEDWAYLGGAWLIEGPRGSREAWLRAYAIDEVTPGLLRRAIEVLCSIPWLAHFVRGNTPFQERSFYLCAASASAERAEVLRVASLLEGLGYSCTYRWWDDCADHEDPALSLSVAQTRARQCLEGLRAAELVVFLEPSSGRYDGAGDPLNAVVPTEGVSTRGGYIELGAALERALWSGQRIVIVSEDRASVFFEAKGCTRVSSAEELRAHLAAVPGG